MSRKVTLLRFEREIIGNPLPFENNWQPNAESNGHLVAENNVQVIQTFDETYQNCKEDPHKNKLVTLLVTRSETWQPHHQD